MADCEIRSLMVKRAEVAEADVRMLNNLLALLPYCIRVRRMAIPRQRAAHPVGRPVALFPQIPRKGPR